MLEPATISRRPLVILGCGFVGKEIAKQALEDNRTVFASTRNSNRLAELAALGIQPFMLPSTSLRLADANVVVTFPPSPGLEAELSQLSRLAHRIVYVSTTSVYGSHKGLVDQQTPVAAAQATAQARLASETQWRRVGATVLRAPGIYGPGRGLHRRLRSGTFKLTTDGSNYQSRIHVHDLAALCLRALQAGPRGEALVVGDDRPCTQLEIVTYLCERLNLALPASQPIENAHRTLRASRRVANGHLLQALDYTLRFPTYRQGYAQILDGEPAIEATLQR